MRGHVNRTPLSVLAVVLAAAAWGCDGPVGSAVADATSATDGGSPGFGGDDGSTGLVIDIVKGGDGGGTADVGRVPDVAADVAGGLPDGGDAGGAPDGGLPDAGRGGHPDVGTKDAGGAGDTAVPGDTGGPEDTAGPGDTGGPGDTLGPADAGASDAAEPDDAGPGDAAIADADAAAPEDAGPLDAGDPDTFTPTPEVCTNGKDDDGDGKTDCADTDCTKKPGCFELCGDGVDNDVDGFTDCADPDCKGKPGCVEVCDDGKDNDLDGAKDCADPDCAGGPACAAGLTCDDMYGCMIEQGCGCKLGSCPADVGPCIQTCFNSASCYAGCLDTLPAPMKANWNAWQACLTEQCATVPDAEFEACYTSKCLSEYASCFFVGTLDCDTIYQECLPDCPAGDQHCVDACFDLLTPEAAADSIVWNDCRFDLCDPTGKGSADSLECLVVATWFACVDVAGSCLPQPGGAKSCAQTSDCILGCGGFGTSKQQCLFGCLGGVAPGTEAGVADVWTCAIDACGTTAASFTPACATGALDGACAAQAAGCGL